MREAQRFESERECPPHPNTRQRQPRAGGRAHARALRAGALLSPSTLSMPFHSHATPSHLPSYLYLSIVARHLLGRRRHVLHLGDRNAGRHVDAVLGQQLGALIKERVVKSEWCRERAGCSSGARQTDALAARAPRSSYHATSPNPLHAQPHPLSSLSLTHAYLKLVHVEPAAGLQLGGGGGGRSVPRDGGAGAGPAGRGRGSAQQDGEHGQGGERQGSRAGTAATGPGRGRDLCGGRRRMKERARKWARLFSPAPLSQRRASAPRLFFTPSQMSTHPTTRPVDPAEVSALVLHYLDSTLGLERSAATFRR